ncbi:MAG: N-acetylmuramoyl-L-alanine amidase [Mangrovibacterium sp.]
MKGILSISFCLLLSCLGWAQPQFTVVLDPGHGGFDPGALGNKITEKNIVLDYSLEIGKIVNQLDETINIIYTRTSDKFVPLHQRAAIANENNAELFMSIHVNSFPKPYMHGFEIFIIGMHDSEENLNTAKKENAVILIEDNYKTQYEDFDPNSSESYIIFDLIQEEYLLNSADFSICIQNNIPKYTSRRNRGTRQAGFLVLKETNTASVLVELGYLTNADESKYLLSEKGKQEIANALAQSIIDYKQTLSSEL